METAHDSSSKDCGSLPAATGIQSVEGSLRQRRNLEKGTKQIDANITGGHGEADEKVREEVTFGRTPSGVGKFSDVFSASPHKLSQLDFSPTPSPEYVMLISQSSESLRPTPSCTPFLLPCIGHL